MLAAEGLSTRCGGCWPRAYPRDIASLRSLVGYAEVVAHVQGTLAGEALASAINVATAGFAKRQRTWFRGERGVHWVTAETLASEGLREELRRHAEGEVR